MKTTLKREDGFTIIEVVLVLAIAGLIFLIVFLALPQLQSSRRDTQRKNDAGRLLAATENWAGNHGGEYPAQATVDTQWGQDNVGGDFEDPNGNNYVITAYPASGGLAESAMAYGEGNVCADNADGFATGSARDVAVAVGLENGEYCQDNR